MLSHSDRVKALESDLTQELVDQILCYDSTECIIDEDYQVSDIEIIRKVIKESMNISLSYSEAAEFWLDHSLSYSAGWLMIYKEAITDAFKRYLKRAIEGKREVE